MADITEIKATEIKAFELIKKRAESQNESIAILLWTYARKGYSQMLAKGYVRFKMKFVGFIARRLYMREMFTLYASSSANNSFQN